MLAEQIEKRHRMNFKKIDISLVRGDASDSRMTDDSFFNEITRDSLKCESTMVITFSNKGCNDEKLSGFGCRGNDPYFRIGNDSV